MLAELALPAGKILGGILVLARVAGAFVFVPIPGARQAPSMGKLLIILAVCLALFPCWPDQPQGLHDMGWVVFSLLSEATLGVAVGLVVSLTTEILLVAFQVLGLQAGYTYASTVDPETHADAGVLLVLGQLVSGLLFFAFGLHREVLMIFARSIEVNPPGAFSIPLFALDHVARLGSEVFVAGMRLAVPVVVFLMMVDLSLAMMGRINMHLQLIFLAFPAKMLTTLALTSVSLLIVPRIYRDFAADVIRVVREIVAGG